MIEIILVLEIVALSVMVFATVAGVIALYMQPPPNNKDK